MTSADKQHLSGPASDTRRAPQKRLAVSFGSGGARALGSLGVMSVLRKHSIYPAAVSGASIGALIAAYYGVHGETETLRAWYENRKSYEYFSYLSKPNISIGLFGINRLKPLLASFVKHKSFEETSVPVRIIATNLRTGQQHTFCSGPLIEAVMASIAVPGVMPAYRIKREHYVDGAMTNPTPIDAFPPQAYDHHLAIDFHLHVPKRLPTPNVFETLIRSFQVATHSGFEYHLHRHRRNCTVITPNVSASVEFLRFDRAPFHIRAGVRAGHRLIRIWKEKGLYDQLRAG